MSKIRSSSKISTTVRASKTSARPAHWLLRRCPWLASWVLAELAMAPRARCKPLESRPGDMLTELRIGKRRVRVHAFGEGPLVLFVHGWQSGASELRLLAEAAVAAGFRAALFDMPAHGEAPGWSTSGPEFVRLLALVAHELGPVHAVVGHSLGGMAALTCVAQGLPVAGVVAIAPIPSLEFALRSSARAFGLSPGAKELLARRLEARTHMKRDQLDLARVELTVPVLLMHDLLDRIVPSRHSRRLSLSWPEATLIETCGFGHNRVLVADMVAQSMVAFLATLPAERANTSSEATREGPRGHCAIASSDSS